MTTQGPTATHLQFFVTSATALNSPGYSPLLYNLHQDDKVTGYGIPTAQGFVPMQIHQSDPVLRIAKNDGTFTLYIDTSQHGEYQVWAAWDQQPNDYLPAPLWKGSNSKQNFTLTIDLSKSGLAAFAVKPTS